jgi:hypothetical protein
MEPSHFCMCKFVSGNKAQLALFPKTKLHIQKSNTCRDIEIQSRGICYYTVVQYRSDDLKCGFESPRNNKTAPVLYSTL